MFINNSLSVLTTQVLHNGRHPWQLALVEQNATPVATHDMWTNKQSWIFMGPLHMRIIKFRQLLTLCRGQIFDESSWQSMHLVLCMNRKHITFRARRLSSLHSLDVSCRSCSWWPGINYLHWHFLLSFLLMFAWWRMDEQCSTSRCFCVVMNCRSIDVVLLWRRIHAVMLTASLSLYLLSI